MVFIHSELGLGNTINGMNLRETHNLKVVGSNPTPATKKSP